MGKKELFYVVDWGKHYSNISKWNNETKKRECIFPIKTELPNYCGIEHHWKYRYEPNLTLKGTINKREPTKLVEKIPIYKNYKWEIMETFKHFNGEIEKSLLLLASTHTDKDWDKCYIIIEEEGISKLTPEQYANKQFDVNTEINLNIIKANLGIWNRNTINKKQIPEIIISRFYDENDNVLFGSSVVKGLVSYRYLEGKFSTDNKPIYIGSEIKYDGKGNSECPNPELIKPFTYIKKYLE